jgi:ABC-2 type transport system ATP-binding protein
MIKLIREIRDTRDIHLIVSSHLLRDVEECCEEVLILKDGQIAASCNLAQERQSNNNFLELETTGGNEPFDSAIEQLGCAYAALGQGRYKLVLGEQFGVRDVFRLAAARGVQVRKLSRRQDSLEDIFLKAMENGAAGREPTNGSL